MVLDTIGKRLTYCRSLLGLSRSTIVQETGSFSLKTLLRWESDQNQISQKKLDHLVDYFVSKGLVISKEWVLNGSGTHPINTMLQSSENYNFDEIAYMTLNYAKTYINNFQIYQVNSNFFEPILRFGDYIGGITVENLPSIDNKLCYTIMNGIVNVGMFDYNDHTLKNIYGKTIELNAKPFHYGQITWMTKRL